MIGIVFAFGLVIGSFLNALIHRLYTGDSIFEKSSKCPRCGHVLSSLDLVPILSFAILNGRCRYCHKPISWQYPLVELATAIIFSLIYYQLLIIDYRFFFFLAFACFLIVIFVYDLKHYLILDVVVFPAAVLALVYAYLSGHIPQSLIGAGVLAGFFFLLYALSRGRWIGAGDIKLGIFLGLLVPFPEVLVLFFFAYFIGAVFSVGLIIFGRKKFSDRVPFGTFLTLAAFCAMLWGERIIDWYFRLIGIQ